MYTMHRRQICTKLFNIGFTGISLSVLKPKPVYADTYVQSFSYDIENIKKRIEDINIQEKNDYCNTMKSRISSYYKTNVFDSISCSNDNDVQDIISNLDYIIVMYNNNLEENPHRKYNLRNELMKIYEKSSKYPEIQHKIIDIMMNYYKLI